MKFITHRHADCQIAVNDATGVSICFSGWDTVSIETPKAYESFVASKVTLYDLELHYGPVRDYPNDVRCMGCGGIIKDCDDLYAQCDACCDGSH
jgi:hypothetical protein